MEHPLQTTINRFPEILERNAPGMMRRMVSHMKAAVASSSSGSSHGALFIRVGEEDLVREFPVAIREAFAAGDDPGLSLSLEPESGAEAAPAGFAGSDAAYDALCKAAAGLGIRGLDKYRKDAFITAMKNAFGKARMDTRATEELMPHANAALDAELRALYAKLADLIAR